MLTKNTILLSKENKEILNHSALKVVGENTRIELLDGLFTIFKNNKKTETFKTFSPILGRFIGKEVEVTPY